MSRDISTVFWSLFVNEFTKKNYSLSFMKTFVSISESFSVEKFCWGTNLLHNQILITDNQRDPE